MSDVKNSKSDDAKRVPAVAATFLKLAAEDGTAGRVFQECAVYEQPDAMRLAFADGHERVIGRDAVMRSGLADAFMWHGAKQKHIDAAAIARNPETGRSATVADKRAAVEQVIGMVLDGEWTRRDASPTGGVFFAAVRRLYPQRTEEEVRAFLAAKTKEDVASMRASKRVIDMMAAIKAERVTLSPEAEADLFAGLDGQADDDSKPAAAPDFVEETEKREAAKAAAAESKARRIKKGDANA